MDDALYIRVRGRVLGPYDQEKLQSLARRGQLSRMHELSADGASWSRAANYPELFVGAQVEMPTARLGGAPQSIQANGDGYDLGGGGQQTQAPSQQRQQQWHYTLAGAQRGPVDFANLQMLVATGQVRPEDLVWADGMPAWVPASHVPGLGTASGGQQGAAAAAKDTLPEMLCRSFTSSRPWIMFIVVAIFLYAALDAAGGLYLLVVGGRMHNPVVVSWGIFWLLWALDWTVGALLLNSYHGRLGTLLYSHSRASLALEKAHERLLSVWIFLAINLIVHLVFLGVIAVLVMASEVTLPWLP